MEQLDNPAGRLYQILDEARLKPDSQRTIKVWAEVFGVKSTDTQIIFIRLVQLMNLVDAAKKSVQLLQDVDHALYLQPFENIERVVTSCNFLGKWERFRQYLDDATMVALKFCSDALSRHVGEKVISDVELAELQAEVESLLNQVLDSTLPKELRDVLIQKLEDIRQAVLAYRVSGIGGLRRALESSLGAIFLYREQIEEIEEKRTLSRVFEFMAHLSEILGFALQAAQLAGLVTPLLGPGGN